MHFVGLLWPLLTSRSAGRPNSAMPASPFQASGETSPGKNDDLPRTIAGSTPLPLGRRSFAVSGPLAPVRSASYPVPVRRLTGSFHASFSVRLTTNALRFPSVPATRFREDFHLQVIAHAGPTTGKRDGGRAPRPRTPPERGRPGDRRGRSHPLPARTSRSIPACAGETSSGRGFRTTSSVHPRVCGGTVTNATAIMAQSGPSPRVRGKHRRVEHERFVHGSIPACAGETTVKIRSSNAAKVHPRVCGGNSRDYPCTNWLHGPSPRVRGKRTGARLDARG